MIKKKINESSKISLNFDSIRQEVKTNLSNSFFSKNNKTITIFSLLCIIIVPLVAVLLIIYFIIIAGNMLDRYAEGNKNTQEEYLASFTEDGQLELDVLHGLDIYWYYDENQQYAEFKLFDSDFGSYYNIEYFKGKLKEHPSNEYIEVEHNYKDCEDFHRDMFEIKLDISDYDMDIKYLNKLTEEQETILVSCKLKGENQLFLNFKYRDEKIIINDVTIKYNYYLNEDSYEYEYNNSLLIEISFVYNDNEYILYGRKKA